jgi:SAM-dependent methyltransferase
MDVKEEDILGPELARHWYYVSKGRALLSFLRHVRGVSLLDVGAGSGIFSRQLLDAGVCERATCVDPAYEEERTESHNGREIAFVRRIDRPSQELVVMMDVLEHVDDDVGLLRHYSETLPADGWVLISVPAFQFLWSGHDIFLEHRRRYTKRQIEDVVSRAGLTVVRSRYFFGLLFPAAAAIRLYAAWRLKRQGPAPKSDLRKAPALLNWALTLLNDVERATLFRFNIVAGLTIFCLARRK